MKQVRRGTDSWKYLTTLLAALALAAGAWADEAAPVRAEAAEPAGGGGAADNAQELAKKLSNPVASLISVPFQFNFDEGIGPDSRGSKFTLNLQPVIPISITEDWNVIWRNIMPVIYQSHVIGNSNQGGLGDFTDSLFLSPKKLVGGIVIGVGPAFLLPTATDDRLGSEKWAAGPTVVMLKQSHGWTVGVLANSLWSFAGNDDRDQVKSTFVQPFVVYTTKTVTTFSLNTESTYNWDAQSQPWSIPINFQVAQLMKFGKLPVQLSGGPRYWAETPDTGPSGWGFRFVVTFLFPK